MNKDSKVLLILERSSENLKLNKESGDYILEGIFAQFGIENNNKRIYEEKEYMPHLEYLKQKISKNSLMGELDHPEKFEISLDKVSHVIENLEYDKENRQIKGRVRILDTPKGKIAKSLIDSGIPISISSRAAGSVNESDKKVSIQRIFTYDLVADPGFPDAQLSRINESFGLGAEDNIQIYDASSWDNFNFGEKSTTPKVNEKVENEKINEEMKNFVTIENMERYSLAIKEEFGNINTKLAKLNESSSTIDSTELKALTETVADLSEYIKGLSTQVKENREYMKYTSKMLDESISWTEDEVSKHVKYLIEYTQAEILPHVNGLIGHNNYLAEKLNQTIGYVNEEIAPILDESINHNDYLVEQIANNRKYSQYIAESAVDSTNFDSLVEYTEMVYENALNSKFNKKAKLNETDEVISEEVNSEEVISEEVKVPVSIEDRYTNINEKIDSTLAELKKQKVEKAQEERKYSFSKLLSESNRVTFDGLTQTNKEKVSTTLSESGILSATHLNQKFTSIVEGNFQTVTEPKWLSDAPVNYKKTYESLNETDKTRINSQAQWYTGKLESEYQIKNFWDTRGLNETVETQNLVDEKITLAKDAAQKSKELGYDSSKVSMIRESLQRYKK